VITPRKQAATHNRAISPSFIFDDDALPAGDASVSMDASGEKIPRVASAPWPDEAPFATLKNSAAHQRRVLRSATLPSSLPSQPGLNPIIERSFSLSWLDEAAAPESSSSVSSFSSSAAAAAASSSSISQSLAASELGAAPSPLSGVWTLNSDSDQPNLHSPVHFPSFESPTSNGKQLRLASRLRGESAAEPEGLSQSPLHSPWSYYDD